MDIINARAAMPHFEKGPAAVDTDTGPSQKVANIQVDAHLEKIGGKVRVGTKTEADVANAEVYAHGSMHDMRAGVENLDVRHVKSGDASVDGMTVEKVEVHAKNLDDPSKYVAMTVEHGHITKVEKGKADDIQAGRDAARQEREQRRARK